MEDKMLSLYDYLGKPAGSVLGKQVYKKALQDKITVDSRVVERKNYTGKIMLYPEQFLIEYFKNEQKAYIKKEFDFNQDYFINICKLITKNNE